MEQTQKGSAASELQVVAVLVWRYPGLLVVMSNRFLFCPNQAELGF